GLLSRPIFQPHRGSPKSPRHPGQRIPDLLPDCESTEPRGWAAAEDAVFRSARKRLPPARACEKTLFPRPTSRVISIPAWLPAGQMNPNKPSLAFPVCANCRQNIVPIQLALQHKKSGLFDELERRAL